MVKNHKIGSIALDSLDSNKYLKAWSPQGIFHQEILFTANYVEGVCTIG